MAESRLQIEEWVVGFREGSTEVTILKIEFDELAQRKKEEKNLSDLVFSSPPKILLNQNNFVL